MSIHSLLPISVEIAVCHRVWQTQLRVKPLSDPVTRNFYYIQLELRRRWFVFIRLQPNSSADPTPAFIPAWTLQYTELFWLLPVTALVWKRNLYKLIQIKWKSSLLHLTRCWLQFTRDRHSHSRGSRRIGLHRLRRSGHCCFYSSLCSHNVKLQKRSCLKSIFFPKSSHRFLIGSRSGLRLLKSLKTKMLLS